MALRGGKGVVQTSITLILWLCRDGFWNFSRSDNLIKELQMQSEKKTAEQRLAKRKKPVSLLDVGMFVVRLVDIGLRLYEKYFGNGG